MTQQTTSQQDSTNQTNGDAAAPEAIIGLVTDGAHSLVVARFRTMDQAQAAYQSLKDLERTTSLRIDAVAVASCDANGDIHLGQMTDHSTKTGGKWGIIGGAVLGLIFPPSILASAVGLGAAGAVMGKVRNVFHRSGVTDELRDVMSPNTAGIIALVEDTAVVEVREALAKADRIVAKAIDKQLAAEIDREAALAKQSLTSG
jgi:uncharacterized membrane protein